MPVDTPRYPPRGYCPFEIELQGQRGWVCATPHCDDTDRLCAEVTVETKESGCEHVDITRYEEVRERNPGTMEPPTYFSRERIPVLFGTEEQAIRACWRHADYWWDGEPPSAPAVPLWRNRMAPGYRIFIEAEQRRMWLVRPDGTVTGEVSGTSLSSAMDVYREQTWEGHHEGVQRQQEDDERERIRAWTRDDEPRSWSVHRNDDGDWHPGLPEGHYVEMRIYMPHEMARDVEAVLRHTEDSRGGMQGRFKEWIEDGIRSAAREALARIQEANGG